MTREEYEAKRNARYQRLLAAAQKAEAQSQQAFDVAHKSASVIPMGQPILVGHYSEGRDRAFRNRIDNKMRKGWELHQEAARLRASAQAIQDNGAIYSDDPSAVEKLEAEIKALDLRIKRMKATNKFIKTRKESYLAEVGLTPDEAINALSKTLYASDGFYPPFAISNANANLRRLKDRIEQVKARQSIPYRREEINGIVIEQNPDAMRTQITFDGKPSAEVIKKLKQSGFKWSPTEWQRLISNYAYLNACAIVKESKSL